jgi:hypothetical protein
LSQVGYVFRIDADAVGMRLYPRLFSDYLGRFNNRFTSCRTEIHHFTMSNYAASAPPCAVYCKYKRRSFFTE